MMRLVHYFFFLTAMLMLSALSQSFATGDTVVNVQVLEQNSTGGKTHRAPSNVPIHMYYSDFTSSVFITFFHNMGNVEIELTDSSSGIASFTINNAQGSYSFNITGDDGYYRFDISPESGSQYYAEFWITNGILQQ